MPDDAAYEGWPESAAVRNVARIYSYLYDDIQNGTHTAPSFQDAVSLHELIDAIEKSAGFGSFRNPTKSGTSGKAGGLIL